MNTIKIESEFGHYVGYVNGAPYCSGDTYNEVLNEMIAEGLVEMGHHQILQDEKTRGINMGE